MTYSITFTRRGFIASVHHYVKADAPITAAAQATLWADAGWSLCEVRDHETGELCGAFKPANLTA